MVHMLLYMVILVASFSTLILLRHDFGPLTKKSTWVSHA